MLPRRWRDDENVEKDIFVMKSKELKFKFQKPFTPQDLNLNFEIQILRRQA